MPIKNIYALEEYDKAIYLHKQGFGSLRISKILGYKNRGAIEDWINKDRKPYYFSEKRIQACNSEENIERMKTMNKITQPKAVKISAEMRTKRLPEGAKILSEDLAYILGVVYGDGHVSIKQRRVILSAIDEDFVLTFKNTLEKWSKFKARFFTRNLKKYPYIKNRKIQYVSYIDSKEAAIFLKGFDKNILLNSKNIIKRAFLRGFFDSEGTVLKLSKNNKINLGLACFNTNYNLIILIKHILDSLFIKSNIHYNIITSISGTKTNKPYYSLWIYQKESILKYYSLIGFNIKRKQQRLENQVKYIKSRAEVTKMTEQDKNTVFVGSRPFMKSK